MEFPEASVKKSRAVEPRGPRRGRIETSFTYFYNYLETCINAGFLNEAVNCVISRLSARILVTDVKVRILKLLNT